MEKAQELLNDVTADCECYQQGDCCFDRYGNPTHAINEECNN